MTCQKVFPLPTVGAPSASNSPSALSAQALRARTLRVGLDKMCFVFLCIKASNFNEKVGQLLEQTKNSQSITTILRSHAQRLHSTSLALPGSWKMHFLGTCEKEIY